MSKVLTKGIDVSTHQGNINWSAVKNAGVDFAIIRAGYGREISQKDAQFENNYAGCKSNGIPVGAYWYSYATSVEEAVIEAKVFLKVLKGKTFEYPVYFDMEEKRQFDLGKDTCTAIAKAFMDTVEKAGYWVGLYMSASPLKTYISEEVRKRYAVWVAHYGVSKTSYDGAYGIWQHSSTGKVAGVGGSVDLNNCYINYPAYIKGAGLNGFKKTTTQTTTATTATAKPKVEKYDTYIVAKNDNLWDIAEEKLGNGARYIEIKKLNNLKSDIIHPGDKLKIPKK